MDRRRPDLRSEQSLGRRAASAQEYVPRKKAGCRRLRRKHTGGRSGQTGALSCFHCGVTSAMTSSLDEKPKTISKAIKILLLSQKHCKNHKKTVNVFEDVSTSIYIIININESVLSVKGSRESL